MKNEKITSAIVGLSVVGLASLGVFFTTTASEASQSSKEIVSTSKTSSTNSKNNIKKMEVNERSSNKNKSEKDTDKDKVLTEKKVKPTTIDYSKNITREGTISNSLIESLNAELNKVPTAIVDKYISIGGKIILTTEDIATKYYGSNKLGNIAGLHNGLTNELHIEDRESAIDRALIHEFGHVLDSLTGWSGVYGEDFKELYYEEKDNLIIDENSNHHKRNAQEFFAEVFRQSLINPERTRKCVPKTFNFINSKIKEVKEM